MIHRAGGYRPVTPPHPLAAPQEQSPPESKMGRPVSSGSRLKPVDDSPSTDESPRNVRIIVTGSSSLVRSPRLPHVDRWSQVPHLRARQVVALGSGTFETVRLVLLKPQGTGAPRERAFKPQTPGHVANRQFCADTGIDPHDQRTSERSEAFSRLDARLQAGLVPTTRRAIVTLEERVGATLRICVREQRGVCMDVAEGIAPRFRGTQRIALPEAAFECLRALHPDDLTRLARARGFSHAVLKGQQLALGFHPPPEARSDARWSVHALVAMDFGDPALRMRLVQLQWLDFIGAQVDRHGENYAVARNARLQVTGVSGWDNDFCFGSALGKGPAGVHVGTPPPDAIDAALCARIRDLARSEEAQRHVIGDALGSAELAALQQRLQVALRKLDELEQRRLVIEAGPGGSMDAWRSRAVTSALGLAGLEAQISMAWLRIVAKTRMDGPAAVVTPRRQKAMREAALDLMNAATRRGLLVREATEQAVMLWWRNGPMQGRADPIRRPVLVLEELWGLQPAVALATAERKAA